MAALGLHLGWNSGQAVLVVLAYFIRGWKELQLATHAASLVSLTIFFLVPESPRWLISQGKLEDAKLVITSMATTNKKILRTDIMNSLVQPPRIHKEEIPRTFYV